MAVNTSYTTNNAASVGKPMQMAKGRFTLSADAITAADYIVLQCGFVPTYIKVENVTDRISTEWYEGMAADTCIKQAAAGTRTLETTNKGLAVCRSDGTADSSGTYFSISQNATLAVIAASKVINWIAIG